MLASGADFFVEVHVGYGLELLGVMAMIIAYSFFGVNILFAQNSIPQSERERERKRAVDLSRTSGQEE